MVCLGKWPYRGKGQLKMQNSNIDSDPSMLAVAAFEPREGASPEANLASFIRMAREELTAFGEDLDWSHWQWKGAGYFLKHGCSSRVGNPEGLHLHPAFVDFAKAYIRYQQSHYPIVRGSKSRLGALRAIEKALVNKIGNANPVDIDHTTLDHAAQIIRENYGKTAAYYIGQRMASIADFLSCKYLTRSDTGTWKNPLPVPDALYIKLGPEAEEHRKKRLPNVRALDAIGTVFARGFDLTDNSTHPDVYLTSAIAMLMGQPGRGQEIHELPTDLEIERPDQEGDLQYGFRYRSFKTRQGTRIKHVPEAWVPIAKEAIRRLRNITEEPRAFARYAEQQLNLRQKDPSAPLRFYRHSGCPSVPDDQPLTAEQVAAALGSNCKHAYGFLRSKGLSGKSGTYTLNSLWRWVLDQLPPGFPYVEGIKNKRLKYSEALFCMHANQLKKGVAPNPISVWVPDLSTLYRMLNGGPTISGFFERHGVRDDNGAAIGLTSHQVRHLLNTLAHEGSGDTFLDNDMINYWSGRDHAWQGVTYNHMPAEELARRAGEAMKREDGSYAVIELPRTPPDDNLPQSSHWTVTRPSPKSCSGIEMHHRSAVLMTAYGCCEHDWLLEPCQFHKDCLNCKEHYCIKGAGKNDMERLERIRALLPKVVVQQGLAQAAADRQEPGASFWYEYQTNYRERLEQLIALLESSAVVEGAKIQLVGSTANSHLHRVLRATALRELESLSVEKDVIDALLIAYRENRALQLHEQENLAVTLSETGHA